MNDTNILDHDACCDYDVFGDYVLLEAMFLLCNVVALHAANGGWSLQIWTNMRVPLHKSLAKFCLKKKH
jgi:hypothetical protein